MGRPRVEAGRQATTERLLAAAELEFGEHGFAGAKLSDIAARAGIRRPSLLYHYKTKEALYAALVRAVLTELGQVLQAAMQSAEGFDAQLDGIVGAFVGFLTDRPAAARLVLREIMDGHGPGHALLLEEGVPLLELVEGFLREQSEGRLPPGLPIRGALMQVVASVFVKASSGDLATAFWGPEDPHRALARHLFERKGE